MRRISSVAFIGAFISLSLLTGMIGCSGGGSETTPPTTPDLTANATLPLNSSGEGVILGYFQFVFEEDSVWVEEVEPEREAEMDVGGYALLIIDDFFFKEDERNWYITATIKNVSPFTGYDVRAVFHSMGNKFVINPDGFIWALPPKFPVPTRCPFIAYGKDMPNRIFPPMYQDTRTVVIHQPTGIPKLAPIGFWIDAMGKNRPEPLVEDLKVEEIDDTNYHLTGHIFDHQSPSGGLVVWANTASFNGNTYVPLFDDGNHGDGYPNDNLWGCSFSGDPDDGLYVITIYAFDPQLNQGENDVAFLHGFPCDEPLQPLPFETIAKGEHSGIEDLKEIVINDPDTWESVWQDHTSWIIPPPPIPPINFENHTVIGVWLGARPSNNHHVTVHSVLYDPCEDLVTVQYVHTPYEACGPLDVVTHPFHIIVLKKFDSPVYFVPEEVPCPEPPPECVEEIPFETLIQGVHSGIKNPYELRISTPDQFADIWEKHTQNMWPPPPPPPINFEQVNVIAVATGERNTGGFECIVERICFLANDHIGVFYKERIPGPDCNVPQVFTQPYHWVLMPKFDAPVMFFKHPEVYNCGPGDCEEPLLFWPIDQGPHTGHGPVEFLFMGPDQFHAFWEVHKPGDPPPPVNWQEHMVLAMLVGERPSTGYWVETVEVCLNGLNDPTTEPRIDVTYIEWQPGDDCEVLWVMTQPYQIIVVPRFDLPVFFHHEVEVYDCPPTDCIPVDFWIKAEGMHSCEPPERFPMFNIYQLINVWHGIHCENPEMPPLPPVGWDEEVPFIIQDHTFQTTGFYLTVDFACIDEVAGKVVIEYTRHEPGPDCPVENIETQPWIIGSVPWVPGINDFEWVFEGHEEVYECPGCVPLPWYQLAEGMHSCAEHGEYGFQGFNQEFEDLWVKIHCDDPVPLPPIPDPIENGEMKPFVVQLGERPSTGYYVTIDDVCLDGCTGIVTYTEHIPGPDCNVDWVVTKPWAFGVAEFPPIDCEIIWEFVANEEIYECPPCEQVPFWSLEEGNESCAEPGEYGFQYEEQYHQFWNHVFCDDPPPLPANPEPTQDGIIYNFGIQLPPRPTTGYYMTIEEVCFEGCDVFVTYTEHIPGQNCDVEPVETKPWMVAAVELPPVYCYWQWHFEKLEEVYDCPDDPCWDFETVAGGAHHGTEDFMGLLIDSHPQWYEYWTTYHPGQPMPPINFEGGWGAYVIHLGMRPTTGYEVEVFEICESEDPFGVAVRWVEWIPGSTCDVLQIETMPWTAVTFPLVDLPYFDEGFEEVYECD